MPRYAHQKPVSRLYSYNYGYMNNYYKPLTHYMERKEKSEDVKKGETTIKTTTEQIVEKPGHQSLAERLKTFPMDGTIYRVRATSAPPSSRAFDDEGVFTPKASKASRARSPDISSSTAQSSGRRARDQARARSSYDSISIAEVSDARQKATPLWMKHPYRLAVEDEVVPPHESSIWPENVPHFNLVSSYDAMVGYLGLKYPVIA